MASEKTLYTALGLFNDPGFRSQRSREYPGTCPEWDARAAAFAAMDGEGRFDRTTSDGHMTPEEDRDFKLISGAVLKMSR